MGEGAVPVARSRALPWANEGVGQPKIDKTLRRLIF